MTNLQPAQPGPTGIEGPGASEVPFGRRMLIAMMALIAASTLWFSGMHLFYQPKISDFWVDQGIAPKVRELMNQHLKLWSNPDLRRQEIDRMRGSNAEWDFMGRTFLVLALANLSFREPPAKAQFLFIMDMIIEETLKLEKEKSFYFFLMDYAQGKKFLASPARSIFVDGEIAAMLAARRLVEEKEAYRPLLRERVDVLLNQMNAGSVLCGESYPDECWTFCNCIALAAIKMQDCLERENHEEFYKTWIKTAKEKLVEKTTGIIVSSFQLGGLHGDGPEGTSIWLVAHCLKLIDEEFAKDQYWKARNELKDSLFGFGYAHEWPKGCPGGSDIDSGPILPFIDLSAGSTGLAFLGAATFGDTQYLQSLLTSLEYGAFPMKSDGCLRYAASNQVGDAVLLYSLTQGPLWKEVKARTRP